MEIKKAILILRKHNEWRRYDGQLVGSPDMQDPTEVGIALDTVIDELEDRL